MQIILSNHNKLLFIKSLFAVFVCWIVSAHTVADEHPNLVLLPIEVVEAEDHFKGTYENALVESLSNQYTVFYGSKVERQLEKEYEKIDCTVEACNQNLAIAFNGELVADASVLPLGNGYIVKLKITNVLDDKIVKTKTVPCRSCDQFAVISKLQNILNSSKSNSSQDVAMSPQVPQVQSDARAILIFDSNPSGAEVYINNKLEGKTPYQGLNHKVGDQLNIKVKEPSHTTYEFNVSLSQAITQLDPITLEAGKAKLMVLTEPYDPDAVVYVDGNAKGIAPLEIDVTTETHEIYAKTNGKKTKVEQVVLNSGESQQLVLSFSVTSPVLEELGIELVDIPAGSFMMGSNDGTDYEKPVHKVNVPAFKMMKYEVTWNNYQPCIDDGVCSSKIADNGFGKGQHPILQGWNDTQDYIHWLNLKTGLTFRLPSEAEWEYAARAGSSSKYSWGNEPSGKHANAGNNSMLIPNKDKVWPVDGFDISTAPVGSFLPNEYGLYDMYGNVSEWAQDCWNDSYFDAPDNGSARNDGNCKIRVLRGGSWASDAFALQSSSRSAMGITLPDGSILRDGTTGFRLVLDN